MKVKKSKSCDYLMVNDTYERSNIIVKCTIRQTEMHVVRAVIYKSTYIKTNFNEKV